MASKSQKNFIQPGGHYRDRNHVVVQVKDFNPESQVVKYARPDCDIVISTCRIIFTSRFIRFDV